MARPRLKVTDENQFVSTLPAYDAKKSSDYPEWLIVYCHHEDCVGHEVGFLVHRKSWYNSRPQIGRSCPYCFRVGRLPKQRAIRRR